MGPFLACFTNGWCVYYWREVLPQADISYESLPKAVISRKINL